MYSTEQLLTAAGQLPDAQLDELAQQVARLAANRRFPALPSAESEWLREINREPNAGRVKRYQQLQAKRESSPLDAKENQELLTLSDWLEETHAERLRAVAELARLRGLSLTEMMKKLGVGHLVNGA